MNRVVVVAKVRIKEEFYLDVYEELLLIYRDTHANDEGCIQYDLHSDIDDKHTFVFVETWENEIYLEEHMQTEHFLKFVKKASDKLELLEVNKLIKIEV